MPRRDILSELREQGAPLDLLDNLQSYWTAQDQSRYSGVHPPPVDTQLLQHAVLLSGLLRLGRLWKR